jgi:hypothetical protein
MKSGTEEQLNILNVPGQSSQKVDKHAGMGI